MEETEIVFRGGLVEAPLPVVGDPWPDPPPAYVYLAAPASDPDRPAEKYVLTMERDDEQRLVYELHWPTKHGPWPRDSQYVEPQG